MSYEVKWPNFLWLALHCDLLSSEDLSVSVLASALVAMRYTSDLLFENLIGNWRFSFEAQCIVMCISHIQMIVWFAHLILIDVNAWWADIDGTIKVGQSSEQTSP